MHLTEQVIGGVMLANTMNPNTIRIRLFQTGLIFQISIVLWLLSMFIPLAIFKTEIHIIQTRFSILLVLTIAFNAIATIFGILTNIYLFKTCQLLNRNYFRILLLFVCTWPIYFLLMLYFDNKLRQIAGIHYSKKYPEQA